MIDYDDLAEEHPEALTDDPDVITEADVVDPEFQLINCCVCGTTEYAVDMIPQPGWIYECFYCYRRELDEAFH